MLAFSYKYVKPAQGVDVKGFVYHIKNPNDDSIEEGYVGVVKESKGAYKRFREHASDMRRVMSHHISSNNISFDNVEILFEGDIFECYQLEAQLRPRQRMGWNLAKGGGGPYYSSIENLNKFRSELQTERMKDEELKKRQGESFKENYYANEQSQKLRKQRSREHMADPIKKQKCLSAIHKKKKCPHCEYENNAGNVAIHIKKHHKEILNDN